MPITISGSTGISGVDGTVASPAIQGTDTNTGVYYPAADQVAIATGGVQRLLVNASGAVTTTAGATIAGTLSFDSGYGSAAAAYGCRAWVNFNGTGTVAIRASGNVSSITDNGLGDYTMNFTTAMPDNSYAWTGSAGHDNQLQHLFVSGPASAPRATWRTTTSLRVVAVYANVSANTDPADFNVAVFR